jgi:zinc protease
MIREFLRLFILACGLGFSILAGATPAIQTWYTGNGARVLFVPAPELPMVDVEISFDAGSARDGGASGLSQLTASLLNEGAGGLSADQLAARLEGLGAQLGIDSGRDAAQVSLRSLSDPAVLQPAVELFAKVVAEPAFGEAAFRRVLEQMRVSLRHDLQSPSGVAQRAFYRAVFGDHPYATPPGGTEESLSKLTREQVRAFHRRYYVARNAVVAIVGDLRRDVAEALAERVAGGLPAGEAPPPLPPVKHLGEARTVRIKHPSKQSHVLMGQPGMHRGDPDYFALYLANHILGGGGLVSRLSDEVREKRGLSYSIYSYFAPMRRNGPFVVGLQTRNDQVGEAIRVVRETVEKYRASGPDEEEYKAHRDNVTGGFPLRIDSNRKILGYLSMIGLYGLPLDYLDTFVGRIEALDREGVAEAFRRRVDPARWVTVIVGGEG